MKKGANPVKTKDELNTMKEEVETLNKKLSELSEEELAQVSGGGEVDNATFLCEYGQGIMLYRAASGAYLLVDTLNNGNERIVENARDFEDVAYELKELRPIK